MAVSVDPWGRVTQTVGPIPEFVEVQPGIVLESRDLSMLHAIVADVWMTREEEPPLGNDAIADLFLKIAAQIPVEQES